MGMDVIGKNKESKTGKYFRNSIWSWRPLADYIIAFAPPNTIKSCKHWHSNDGDGLNNSKSLELAKFLREEVKSGRTKVYEIAYRTSQNALKDQRCDLCDGTGIRTDGVGKVNGFITRVIDKEGHPRNGKKGWCNKCDGIGHVRPAATWYPFSVENVTEFCEFLENCGGFEIF